jgi:hypothetical protein
MESLYHYGMSSGKQFDPLYRTSVVGSYILPNSYRKLKPHRSWWSLFVPRNLFIPIRFANILKSPNTKARDMFGGRGIFTISPNYWRTWYGNEFASWINPDKINLESLVAEKAPDLNFLVDDHDEYAGEVQKTYISAHKDPNVHGSGYFRDSLMYYLAGNYNLYRPGLVKTELWQWDLSGESDYGLITPPVDTEYEPFDRNFSVQFVVHGKGIRTCKDIGLECVNPSAIQNGPVLSASGCTASPYCNCPAQYNIPIEAEPTYLEIQKLYNEINECALIENVMGKDYLGCDYKDPNLHCSCNCPEQGKLYNSFNAMTKTYATFWNTPPGVPLQRNAEMVQLESQKLRLKIYPNPKVKIGKIVEIFDINDIPENTKYKYKAISGRWMVYEIFHRMTPSSYSMEIILVRDSLPFDPEEAQVPTKILDANN